MKMSGILRLLISACLALWPVTSLAATVEPIYSANVDLSNKPSLQRGARMFVNYCMGCHSATYMRYERLMLDLDIPEDILRKNFMFGDETVFDAMDTAMRPEQAADWFLGVAPPDLTLSARSRGTDWLYSFLLTFYVDPERPAGYNNMQFPDTAMPHVLWELQGLQQPIYAENDNGEVVDLETLASGRMDADEYERAVTDLVNFLAYISEPARLVRTTVGVWVILYLFVLLIIAYLLKKEYWKDVD